MANYGLGGFILVGLCKKKTGKVADQGEKDGKMADQGLRAFV